jgi:hypothetical protein
MPELTKLNRDLAAILPMAKLEPPAAALLTGCTDTEDALQRLRSAGDLTAATRLAAFALPRREAVWWASMCALHTAPENQPQIELKTRETAELWVRRQDDTTRRQAMDLARQAGFAAPESWAAVAAFWSGDSMSPLGQPAVPPAPHLAGTAVSGAIALAAVRGDPSRRPARLERFLISFQEIAAGGAGRLEREMTTA